MKIEINDKLKAKIVAFCDDELGYHILYSGCAEEYKDEITAQIELLRLLGYGSDADGWQMRYDEYMENHNN